MPVNVTMRQPPGKNYPIPDHMVRTWTNLENLVRNIYDKRAEAFDLHLHYDKNCPGVTGLHPDSYPGIVRSGLHLLGPNGQELTYYVCFVPTTARQQPRLLSSPTLATPVSDQHMSLAPTHQPVDRPHVAAQLQPEQPSAEDVGEGTSAQQTTSAASSSMLVVSVKPEDSDGQQSEDDVIFISAQPIPRSISTGLEGLQEKRLKRFTSSGRKRPHAGTLRNDEESKRPRQSGPASNSSSANLEEPSTGFTEATTERQENSAAEPQHSSESDNEPLLSRRSTILQTVPQIVPQTVPQTVSQTVPKTVPKTTTKTVPKKVPKTVPKTATKITAKTVPKTAAKTVPKTAGKTVPKTATKIATKLAPKTSRPVNEKQIYELLLSKKLPCGRYIVGKLSHAKASKANLLHDDGRLNAISARWEPSIRRIVHFNMPYDLEGTRLALPRGTKMPRTSNKVTEYFTGLKAFETDQEAFKQFFEKFGDGLKNGDTFEVVLQNAQASSHGPVRSSGPSLIVKLKIPEKAARIFEAANRSTQSKNQPKTSSNSAQKRSNDPKCDKCRKDGAACNRSGLTQFKNSCARCVNKGLPCQIPSYGTDTGMVQGKEAEKVPINVTDLQTNLSGGRSVGESSANNTAQVNHAGDRNVLFSDAENDQNRRSSDPSDTPEPAPRQQSRQTGYPHAASRRSSDEPVFPPPKIDGPRKLQRHSTTENNQHEQRRDSGVGSSSSTMPPLAHQTDGPQSHRRSFLSNRQKILEIRSHHHNTPSSRRGSNLGSTTATIDSHSRFTTPTAAAAEEASAPISTTPLGDPRYISTTSNSATSVHSLHSSYHPLTTFHAPTDNIALNVKFFDRVAPDFASRFGFSAEMRVPWTTRTSQLVPRLRDGVDEAVVNAEPGVLSEAHATALEGAVLKVWVRDPKEDERHRLLVAVGDRLVQGDRVVGEYLPKGEGGGREGEEVTLDVWVKMMAETQVRES